MSPAVSYSEVRESAAKMIPVPCPVPRDWVIPLLLRGGLLLVIEAGVPDPGGRSELDGRRRSSPGPPHRGLGPCLGTLPFPAESRTGEELVRMKVGVVRPLEGLWPLRLISSLGEFEAVLWGHQDVPESRNPHVALVPLWRMGLR